MFAEDAPLRVERGPGSIVLIGEIDAHTEAQVRDELTCAPDSGDVRIDFSGVTFIDSSGLRVVLQIHQKLLGEGRRLVLVAPSTAVTRLIVVAGLFSYLHVEPPLDSADTPQRSASADR